MQMCATQGPLQFHCTSSNEFWGDKKKKEIFAKKMWSKLREKKNGNRQKTKKKRTEDWGFPQFHSAEGEWL